MFGIINQHRFQSMQGNQRFNSPSTKSIGLEQLTRPVDTVNSPRIINSHQRQSLQRQKSVSNIIENKPLRVQFTHNQNHINNSQPQMLSNFINLPIHKSVRISSQPILKPEMQHPQSYKTGVNPPPIRQTTLQPLGPRHPLYKQLVSPQQIDYTTYPMAKTRENITFPDQYNPKTVKYSNPPPAHQVSSRYEAKGQKSSAKDDDDDGSCWKWLMGFLCCLALLCLLLGLFLVLSRIFAGGSIQKKEPIVSPEISNGTAPQTETYTQTIEQPIQKPHKKPHTSPGMIPPAYPVPLQRQIIVRKPQPYLTAGMTRRVTQTQPGNIPYSSYMYPSESTNNKHPPIDTAISTPMIWTQVPKFDNHSDFQYPPGSRLSGTMYETSLHRIRYVDPLSHKAKKGILHRLRFRK